MCEIAYADPEVPVKLGRTLLLNFELILLFIFRVLPEHRHHVSGGEESKGVFCNWCACASRKVRVTRLATFVSIPE